jgi:hypothetical protein
MEECNSKQGRYSDCNIPEMRTMNKIVEIAVHLLVCQQPPDLKKVFKKPVLCGTSLLISDKLKDI